jgi:ATP-dependent Clp protease, protease subunit
MSDVLIYGDIGTAPGQIASSDVALQLAGKKDVTVRINSSGGDVFEAIAIFNLLKEKAVNVQIDAACLSAASLVAMAGNTIRMASNAMMMIHNAWTVTAGNKDDMRQAVKVLGKVDQILIDTYAGRTGLSKWRVKNLLDAESWFTADEAVALELADIITGQSSATVAFDESKFNNVPRWAALRGRRLAASV